MKKSCRWKKCQLWWKMKWWWWKQCQCKEKRKWRWKVGCKKDYSKSSQLNFSFPEPVMMEKSASGQAEARSAPAAPRVRKNFYEVMMWESVELKTLKWVEKSLPDGLIGLILWCNAGRMRRTLAKLKWGSQHQTRSLLTFSRECRWAIVTGWVCQTLSRSSRFSFHSSFKWFCRITWSGEKFWCRTSWSSATCQRIKVWRSLWSETTSNLKF